jgi:hypothetical protein
MPVIYKTLFEVKLMHEYYLTKKDGFVVFENTDQQARLDFLLDEFKDERPSVNENINFEFPENLKQKYESLFLRLLPTYSGCRVVVRVNSRTLSDQSVVYEPVVPLSDTLNIFILFSRKNFNIDTYTNARVKRSCPSVYFFSNIDVLSSPTFPFLTGSVPVQEAAVQYEQGELSLSGTQIQEYYREAGTDKWNDVVGTGFANESDRLLLPLKFDYTFNDTTNLTTAVFILKYNNGNTAATITESNAAGIRTKILLNFSGKVKPLPFTDSFQLSEFIYTLEVNGNNGYSEKHKIIFNNDLTATNPWAVVNIGATAGNTAFNLFANDGFLIRRKDAMGVWTPAPVFEIPVKSRLAYWRFINNRGKELTISAALTDYLNKENKVLVTKKPRSLAKSWFFLRKEGSSDTVYVPNPVAPELKLESDRRLFFDIRVPQSDLFEVV